MYSEGFGLIQCPATPYRTSQCIELCMYSEGFGFLAKVSDSYNAPGLASAMDVMELCKHSKGFESTTKLKGSSNLVGKHLLCTVLL